VLSGANLGTGSFTDISGNPGWAIFV